MYIPAIITALVAAVAASPLQPRTVTGGCSLATTTTKLGTATATLRGPFIIKASATGPVNANYAEGAPGQKITYDNVPSPKLNATKYYLNPAGHLNMIDTGKLYTSYEYLPLSGNGAILFNTNPTTNMACTLSSSTCALACKAGPNLQNAYNVLLSPKDKPDWYISQNASVVPKNAIPFTPYAIAV